MLNFLKPRKKKVESKQFDKISRVRQQYLCDIHTELLADKIRSADEFGTSTISLSSNEAVALLVFLQSLEESLEDR
mgnify:CR=1 FL=1